MSSVSVVANLRSGRVKSSKFKMGGGAGAQPSPQTLNFHTLIHQFPAHAEYSWGVGPFKCVTRRACSVSYYLK